MNNQCRFSDDRQWTMNQAIPAGYLLKEYQELKISNY